MMSIWMDIAREFEEIEREKEKKKSKVCFLGVTFSVLSIISNLEVLCLK